MVRGFVNHKPSLKRGGYYIYHQVQEPKILRSAQYTSVYCTDMNHAISGSL